ncbi:MAG: sugar transferase [Bacteroidales bacterium]|nr:sugar transferase [Bacteroidales bacterium]
MMIKRLFDIIASFLGLLILFPLFLLIALLIRMRMPGPMFFCQKRAGKHGKLFILYKFRTMVVDHGGSSISVRGESRITPLGTKLRKYKLDELPELWNVLKGDMSFVGPRPDLPEYINKLTGEEKKILELRPGITGPASLKYANEEELLSYVSSPQEYNDNVLWPDKVRLNLQYYMNRSFFGDIVIILQTIFRRGA